MASFVFREGWLRYNFFMIRKYRDKWSASRGFTLVELAIVMVIIGLLIGGILKGAELVRTAKVNATISYVKATGAAIETFRDKYNAAPGDSPIATTRVPGCVAPCVGGNGDGIVGILLTESTWGNQNQAGTSSLPAVETSMFWKHLALADIITGVQSSAPVSPAEAGVTHPRTPVGGVFEIATVEHGVTQNIGGGFILRMQASPGPLMGAQFLEADMARQIDEKMDDGNPFRGIVAGDFEGSGCGIAATHTYNSDGSGLCVMYFKLGNR